MKRKYFSGDTLAQALGEASRHFGLDPSEINYQQVDKRHGFLKIRRRFLIEVDPEQPRRPESGPAPRPERAETGPRRERPRAGDDERERREPAGTRDREAEAGDRSERRARRAPAEAEAGEPRDREQARDREQPSDREEPRRGRPRRRRGRGEGRPGGAPRGEGEELVELPADPAAATDHHQRATGEEAEAARKALDLLFELSSLQLEAEVLQGDEELVIEVRGGSQDLLLDDRGRLLLAIQHLVPRMIRGLIGRSVACHVDSDNFREIREERLRDLAQRTAEEVRRLGRSETLEPMSPDERRIVHLTLTDDPAVDTRSHGSGLFKRVTVSPAHRRRPRGFDPYRR